MVHDYFDNLTDRGSEPVFTMNGLDLDQDDCRNNVRPRPPFESTFPQTTLMMASNLTLTSVKAIALPMPIYI